MADNTVTLSATSPATPSCASPPSGRRSPASASPSTAAGPIGSATSGRSSLLLRRRPAGASSGENVSAVGRQGRPRRSSPAASSRRSWETQDGDKRSKVEVVADEVGPSLRWATREISATNAPAGAPVAAVAAGGPRRGPTAGPAATDDEEPF